MKPSITIENLSIDHAEEMFLLLNDSKLHKHIGGHPIDNIEDFRTRYAILSKQGSSDGKEEWVNWIIKSSDVCIGYVQATIKDNEAYIAWVVGIKYQNKGYASEAIKMLINWILKNRTNIIKAKIGKQNDASQKVALKSGLIKTAKIEDDEEVWLYQHL